MTDKNREAAQRIAIGSRCYCSEEYTCSTHEAIASLISEVREGERDLCATKALEQRCERGTPWDAACVAIAAAIRKGEA